MGLPNQWRRDPRGRPRAAEARGRKVIEYTPSTVTEVRYKQEISLKGRSCFLCFRAGNGPVTYAIAKTKNAEYAILVSDFRH